MFARETIKDVLDVVFIVVNSSLVVASIYIGLQTEALEVKLGCAWFANETFKRFYSTV